MFPGWPKGDSVTATEPEPVEWDGVALFTSPWVSGLKAASYFGPISVELWADDGVESEREAAWVKAEAKLLEKLREKAFQLGANAVVGLDITLNPFAVHSVTNVPGLYLHAVGTAAKLEKVF